MSLLKNISFAAVSLFFLSGCGESSQELWKKANNGDLSATKELAESGDADAQNNLGKLYAKGQVVPQDDAEAVKWYRLAADQGLAEAQLNLGAMYYNGQGVPKDLVEAYAWWFISAAGGDADAANNRVIVAGKLTPEQLLQGQKRATELFEKISSGKSLPHGEATAEPGSSLGSTSLKSSS